MEEAEHGRQVPRPTFPLSFPGPVVDVLVGVSQRTNRISRSRKRVIMRNCLLKDVSGQGAGGCSRGRQQNRAGEEQSEPGLGTGLEK